ncbi:unknown [Crocosphaera subtropica ATCC 51142]|uniref:Uncharacterized protein n=1 Tax=Crocosphaera subtropica (strain ATCC 51142 / BH68) TaxID=43989 RepID=B1WZ80_CROS5|nr:hypothetical protein [Crocosphaera subtropica]ACB49446.1 unknown [Crocosphaera subtropica ATCC 51142]
MSTLECEVNQSLDFSSLKNCHEELYQKVSDIIIKQEISETQKEKNDCSKEMQEVSDSVKNLLKNLAEFAPQVTSIDESNWVREASYEWGAVGDCLDLNLSLLDTTEKHTKVGNIGQKILSLLPNEIPEFSLTPKISKKYLEKEAYCLGQARKERLLKKLLGEYRHLIHNLIPSDLENMKMDWCSACTYFSSKILEGKLDFSSQIESDLYHYLEEVWLEDVKHLRAYEIWWKKGHNRIYEESTTVNYYFQACQQIMASLVDPYIKAPFSRFEELKNYLKNCYLTEEGKLDKDKSNTLIEIKAHRIWETTNNSNSSENWSSAQQYVEDFYENIIPAVVDGDLESITKVKNAIQAINDPTHYHIINCFEVALVIYFLPSDVLEDVEKL